MEISWKGPKCTYITAGAPVQAHFTQPKLQVMPRVKCTPKSTRQPKGAIHKPDRRGCLSPQCNLAHRFDIWDQTVGKVVRAKYRGQCRGKLELPMLCILKTPWWRQFSPEGYTTQLLHKLKPLLKGVRGDVASRLGWHPFARQLFFGNHSRLQAPRLVWLIQTLERAEFEAWTSMFHGFHGAPLGVRDCCAAALPVLSGWATLPALPSDTIGHILKITVVSCFWEYAFGPIGFRSSCVFDPRADGCPAASGLSGGQCQFWQLVEFLDLRVALMPCHQCKAVAGAQHTRKAHPHLHPPA